MKILMIDQIFHRLAFNIFPFHDEWKKQIALVNIGQLKIMIVRSNHLFMHCCVRLVCCKYDNTKQSSQVYNTILLTGDVFLPYNYMH